MRKLFLALSCIVGVLVVFQVVVSMKQNDIPFVYDVLEKQEYSNITSGGGYNSVIFLFRQIEGCDSRLYSARYKIRATNKNGEKGEATVCLGWPFKEPTTSFVSN